MNKLKTALFDLDGVVFNTEPQYTDFWGSQCREFHPEHPNLEHEIKGQTLTQIFDGHFNGPLLAKRELITARLNKFEKNMTFDYIAGFEDFIAALRTNGVKTAVVTSSNNEKMQTVYHRHPEFKTLFDEILTAEDFTQSKPHPECYLKAAQRFGTTPRECIVFEDSFNGLKSACAARMTVVGLATTNSIESIAPYSDIVICDYRNMSYADCDKILTETILNNN